MTETVESTAPVLTSVRQRTGLLELNRPKALNSLDPEMIEIIGEAVRTWENDDAIDQIVIYSTNPKAFCAGGDVRYARDNILNGNADLVDDFFRSEYTVNGELAQCTKPVVAIINGVVMGGGLGISLHGSHRVVTENAFASMPEMAIGYFTDVGVAHTAQRMVGTRGQASEALAKYWAITGYRYDIPVSGTAAHAWTLAHVNEDGTPNEEAAFRGQIETLGVDTTLLVDTYDITKGVETAVRVAGPELGGVRIDSGDLAAVTRRVRKQLDDLGNHNTKIVVSSDLDEFAIAGLRGDPVDVYGVGTSVVTGSGAPTAGMVYKVVEVDGHPVAKRSSSKKSQGGAKRSLRTYRSSGVAVEELVLPFSAEAPDTGTLRTREMTVPLMRDGEILDNLPTLEESREYLAQAITTLPWEGLALTRDEPAVPTRFIGFGS